MNLKLFAVISVSLAVVAGSVAYVKNGMSREVEARLLSEKAVAEEAAAEAKRKTAKAEADKAAAEKKIAEENAAAQADAKKAAELEKESSELKLKAESENRLAKEAAARLADAERETAALKAKTAADTAKAVADEKEKAKAFENAEAHKAAAEADKLAAEKLRSEKVIAEAKMLELSKIEFAAWQRDLLELEQSLNERERALKPEKTIANLAWTSGGDDMVLDEDGKLKKSEKTLYLPEQDMSLPLGTRRLSKVERITSESAAAETDSLRKRLVAQLEKMYVDALKENRVIDARYYKQNLKSLYPDWEFKGDDGKKEKEESRK